MTWSSIDIRRQRFHRRLRGYDTQEVNLFLSVLAEEIERLTHLVRKTEHEKASIQEHLDELLEKERYIRNTLVAVQQTRDRLEADTRRKAELLIKEAELERDRILAAASKELNKIFKEIETLRMERRHLQEQILAETAALTRWIQQRREAEKKEASATQVRFLERSKRHGGSG